MESRKGQKVLGFNGSDISRYILRIGGIILTNVSNVTNFFFTLAAVFSYLKENETKRERDVIILLPQSYLNVINN